MASTVGKKSYFTVPTQSVQQYILEEIQGIDALFTTYASTLDQFLAFRLYAADIDTNDTVLYKIEVPFTGLTSGSPLRFEFGFTDREVFPYVAPGMV